MIGGWMTVWTRSQLSYGFATLLVVSLTASVSGDAVVYVETGAEWAWFAGLEEPSPGDPEAWRSPGYDDAGWERAAAPFGYGDPPYGTDLSERDPPMRASYSTVYLRRTFEVEAPGALTALHARVDYDDGVVVWINGAEVLRSGADGEPGSHVPFDARASSSHESGEYVDFDLPDPDGYLVAGRNVIAVQLLNRTISSTDAKVDVELLDPFGPDRTPPRVVGIDPVPDGTVRALTTIRVTFDESVDGVDAADLLVNGAPADRVEGTGEGPYAFEVPAVPAGPVTVAWADGAAITDRSFPPNPFAGDGWSYTVDPDAPVGDLVISEVLSVNRTGLVDEDGDTPDWVEILNRGSESVQLQGWGLTDDESEPGKWTFPRRLLGPGERIVVLASGKDRRPESGELHTSFRISGAGEYLGLTTPDVPRVVVSSFAPRLPELRADISVGIDGRGVVVFFSSPTPGEPNDSPSVEGLLPEPRILVPRGFHDAPISVGIVSDAPDVEVFYTLDGSEPTPATGERYVGPVTVAGSTGRGLVALRAAAFRDGWLPSRTVTTSWVFPEHVLSQPRNPPGFPGSWPGTTADYELDADVLDRPGNRDLALRALTDIPTISVVTDIDHLFHSSTGIYANPSHEGLAWERPTSAELILPDGGPGFQIDCGIRVQGGSSTQSWKSKKVSLRLFFKGDYGPTKLRYRLFPDSPVDSFDTVVLDAHLNLTWTHPDHGQRVRSQYVRDAYVSDLQNAMGSLAPHDIFVHLYLNGVYWGVYDLHERPDASFGAEYLGGEKGDYDAYRHNSATLVDGTSAAWTAMFTAARRNLADPASYLALQEYLDVEDLADYMIANLYAGNTDWAHQNWYAARRSRGDPIGGYRFFSWDAEHVLKGLTDNVVGVSNAGGPGELYSRLRASPEFRMLFGDHVHRHVSPGGPLFVDPESTAWDPESPESNRPAALYMRRIEEVDASMVLESARWGDVRRSTPYLRELEWTNELNSLLSGYFPRRSAIVLAQLRSAGLYPRVEAPVASRPSGRVAPGTEVSLIPPAGDVSIWYTLDGSDPRASVTGDPAAGAIEYTGPIAVDDLVRLRAVTLSGTAWSALLAEDYEIADPRASLRISEIMYHAPEGADLDWVEIHNSAAYTVDLGGVAFGDGIEYVFPANSQLAAGARIIVAADPDALGPRLVEGVPVVGPYSGSLSNSGERVVLDDRRGDAIDAVEFDDGEFWPVGPDGFGFSLVPVAESDPWATPSGWRASARPGGSPGDEDPAPRHGGVLISEVLSRGRETTEDAIELFNPTDVAIDVSGWYLSDSRAEASSLAKYRLPAGSVLPPGGYLVAYAADFDPDPEDPRSFGLGGSGDDVYLASADADGNLTGHIVGHSFGVAPVGYPFGVFERSDGFDFTLLRATTFGVDDPATVAEFREGTGRPNAPPFVSPVVIHEIHYHPTSGVEFVELHNPTDLPVELGDVGIGGGWELRGVRGADDSSDLEFPVGTVIPAEGFLVVVPVDPEQFRAAFGVPVEAPVVGPYRGALDNSGESLRLAMPVGADETGVIRVVVDRARFSDASPWPSAPDGDGPSLERVHAWDFGSEPLNWGASQEVGGTPGRANSVSDPGANLLPRPSLVVTVAPGTDPREIVADGSGSFDPDGRIVEIAWAFGDGAEGTGERVHHVYAAEGEYRVVLTVTDDRGGTAVAERTVTVRGAPSGGWQIPGDQNQDGALNISDPVALLGRLFLGAETPLPCESSDLEAPGNRALLDVNGDGGVNLSDVVFSLNYLFLGGPTPVLGTGCVRVEGCPDLCSP